MSLNNHQASKDELRFPVQAALKHLTKMELSALSALYSELIVRMEAAGELPSCPDCGSAATKFYDHDTDRCRSCSRNLN